MRQKAGSRFSHRKKDHIILSLKEHNQAAGGSGFQNIQLSHTALPEINFEEVDISAQIFGIRTKTPFIVTGMTGGWKDSLNINKKIAKVCEQRGWIMGAGSQRRQLFDPKAASEWINIRKEHPDLILIGNIGLSQLIGIDLSTVEKLVSSLKANAMVVHTNPLQEALQLEGTPQFKGGLKSLKNLCKKLSVPVVLKETGCGFGKKELELLSGIGLLAVDISGYGGTHWGRIEGERANKEHALYGVSDAFKDWGISTIDSLLFTQEINKDYEVWASGGVRNGCDAAKALALGACRVGVAKPIIEALLENTLEKVMGRLEYELKVALFCSGCRNPAELLQNGKWSWKV